MLANVTLVFFVLLIPLSGFIAWAGDRIGHRSGKKRHSLFGLRPRHTAMVFTVGSGMAIALVSFLLFYVSSAAFRIVVRDGAALYDTNRSLKADNARQAAALNQSRQRADTMRAEVKRIGDERQAAEAAAEAAKERQAKAIQQLSQVQSRYVLAQKDLESARTGLSKASADLGLAQTRLDEKNGQIQRAAIRVRDAESRVADAQTQQKRAEGEATKASQSLSRASKTYDLVANEQGRKLGQQRQLLQDQEGQLISLRADLEKLTTRYADQKKETDAQVRELTRLTAELKTKRDEFQQLVNSTTTLRQRQITYQVGEEVDRLPIRAGYNVWRIQAILDSFLTQAAKKAEVRGATRGTQERAVVILPHLIADMPADAPHLAVDLAKEPSLRSEDDSIRAAADAIRRDNHDVVVIVKAVANAVAGEPVAVDFVICLNPLVLSADTKIGEIVVNSGAPRQELTDLLYSFLSHDVHRKLIEAGMIPVARGGENPEQETSATTATRVPDEFTISGEEWLDIMEDVRKVGPRARVLVYAARDMRAGDKIALRFEVKPVT